VGLGVLADREGPRARLSGDGDRDRHRSQLEAPHGVERAHARGREGLGHRAAHEVDAVAAEGEPPPSRYQVEVRPDDSVNSPSRMA